MTLWMTWEAAEFEDQATPFILLANIGSIAGNNQDISKNMLALSWV
jgi:hypothetical protein